jgi:hypothetical protein
MGASGQSTAARAKNLSDGGLLVSVRDPVPVGSAVDLLIRPPKAPPRGVRAEVVRVEKAKEDEAGYDVGVRFLEAPSFATPTLRRRKPRSGTS